MMLTNKITEVSSEIICVPQLIRAEEDGWIPTFELWETTITSPTSIIHCPQKFNLGIEGKTINNLSSELGYYKDGALFINWQAIIDTEDALKIQSVYKGKMRACNWKKRYCTYFGISSKEQWLHSKVLDANIPGYVVHHINGASVDNRKKNLHIMPKREHDGINHAGLEERKKMFANPDSYWEARRKMAIAEFIIELSVIIVKDAKDHFIARFASINKALAIEIMKAAKIYLNLSSVIEAHSELRMLNPHLRPEYLDTYEIDKYLKNTRPNKIARGQMRLF